MRRRRSGRAQLKLPNVLKAALRRKMDKGKEKIDSFRYLTRRIQQQASVIENNCTK